MELKNTNSDQILIYQAEDGKTRIDVQLQDGTVWLPQMQMADLFQKNKRTISEHIANLYEEGELITSATVRNFRTVQKESNREVERELAHYNLDVIISVGYRVKSHRGTQFRIWATQRLKEYLVKGFVLDDQRLKQAGQGNYFDELLARIRDIRSAKKVFWRKVLDIYATSIDYSPNTEVSQQFFKIIQNKMHWAAHGKTAAEIIASRVDANKPNMGMTSWIGDKPSREEATIAKNYLTTEELDTLNRIVSIYLDFAELQAKSRKPMYMKDWVTKLDEFLHISNREILTHAGKISHEEAVGKVYEEYNKFKTFRVKEPSLVELHFYEAIEKARQLEQRAH